MSTAAVEVGSRRTFRRDLNAVFWLSVGNLVGTWIQIVIALESLRFSLP